MEKFSGKEVDPEALVTYAKDTLEIEISEDDAAKLAEVLNKEENVEKFRNLTKKVKLFINDNDKVYEAPEL